jgi:hypothetical protein
MLAINDVIPAFIGFPGFAGDRHEVLPFSGGLNDRSSVPVAGAIEFNASRERR